MIAPLTWLVDLPSHAWDRYLAQLHGHPLQSALWGDARKAVDDIQQLRVAAFRGESPVFMARCEVRSLARLARVAWIPRGPAFRGGETAGLAFHDLLARLRHDGYVLCIDDRYDTGDRSPDGGTQLLPKPLTAWLDLTRGTTGLSNPKWRYSVRIANRAGVVITQTRDDRDIAGFHALCREISVRKNFELPGSEALFRALLAGARSEAVAARLFVARLEGELAAGALVIRCGRSLHYFWGAVDRRFPKVRAGDAVHWAIIEWAVTNGVERYDLEGIDPVNNPGTSKFKMEMGAIEVALPGRRAYPLSLAGRIALGIGRGTGRL